MVSRIFFVKVLPDRLSLRDWSWNFSNSTIPVLASFGWLIYVDMCCHCFYGIYLYLFYDRNLIFWHGRDSSHREGLTTVDVYLNCTVSLFCHRLSGNTGGRHCDR